MSERPLECSECKKPIKVIYKEIDLQTHTCNHMCESCPILQKKLHGADFEQDSLNWAKKGLCCVKCGTSTESLSIATHLGCSECYHVFEALVSEKIVKEELIPEKFRSSYIKNPSLSFHLGHTPLRKTTKVLSNTVTDLSEALNEALKKENYEQAAQLRDQINQLMDSPDENPSST